MSNRHDYQIAEESFVPQIGLTSKVALPLLNTHTQTHPPLSHQILPCVQGPEDILRGQNRGDGTQEAVIILGPNSLTGRDLPKVLGKEFFSPHRSHLLASTEPGDAMERTLQMQDR